MIRYFSYNTENRTIEPIQQIPRTTSKWIKKWLEDQLIEHQNEDQFVYFYYDGKRFISVYRGEKETSADDLDNIAYTNLHWQLVFPIYLVTRSAENCRTCPVEGCALRAEVSEAD